MPDRPVRIAPLMPAEWTPEVREFLEGIVGAEKAETLNMPLTFARHPRLSRAILDFSLKVQESAEIPARLREIIIMRVVWLYRTDYLWGQHNRMMRRLGMGEEHIQAIKAGSDDALWSAEERSVLRAVEELTRTRELTDGAWKALSEHFPPRQILEMLTVLSQFSMLSLIFNAIGLQLEPHFSEFALERS